MTCRSVVDQPPVASTASRWPHRARSCGRSRRHRHRRDEVLDLVAAREHQQGLPEQRHASRRLLSLAPVAARARPGYGVRRRSVAAPRASAATAKPTTTPRSRQTSSGRGARRGDPASRRRRRTAAAGRDRLEHRGHLVARHEQPAQQDLRDHQQRHELHRLELGRANAQTNSPSAVPSTASATATTTSIQTGPATSRPSRPTLSAPRAPTGPRRPARRRARSRRGSRPCRSASRAAARGCPRSARAAWSRRSPGTSR